MLMVVRMTAHFLAFACELYQSLLAFRVVFLDKHVNAWIVLLKKLELFLITLMLYKAYYTH